MYAMTLTTFSQMETLEGRRLLAAGDLDFAFGNRGVTQIDDGLYGATTMALQSDGKILFGAFPNQIHSGLPDEQKHVPVVARLNPDGSPDLSFSKDGRVEINVAKGWERLETVTALSDGKILIQGTFEADTDAFYVARLRRDGSFDPTFGDGGDGMIIVRRPGIKLIAQENLAVDPAGRILVAGSVHGPRGRGRGIGQDFGVFRLLPDGRLDPAFGYKGVVRINMGNLAMATDVAVQADGKVLVSVMKMRQVLNKDAFPNGRPPLPRHRHQTWDPEAKTEVPDGVIVLRFNTDGSLDHSFGNAGKFQAQAPGGFAVGHDLAIHADGSIMVFGLLVRANLGKSIVQKIRPDGTADTSFGDGGDGNVITDLTGGRGEVLIQPDGKVLLASGVPAPGYVMGQGGPTKLAVRRLNTDGTPDSTYGDGGIAFAFGRESIASAAALQRDGNLVVVGELVIHHIENGNADVVVARFQGGRGSAGSKFAPLRRGIDQQPPRKVKRNRKSTSPRPANQNTLTLVPSRPAQSLPFSTQAVGRAERDSNDLLLA